VLDKKLISGKDYYKRMKVEKTTETKTRISSHDKNIRQFNYNSKLKQIRKSIILGSTKSLWSFVKMQ
jgi:ABC-type Fe3+-citrate transport system substrate-binding protein